MGFTIEEVTREDVDRAHSATVDDLVFGLDPPRLTFYLCVVAAVLFGTMFLNTCYQFIFLGSGGTPAKRKKAE